ncbi:hypothetical protein FOXB_16326 [Fusarium oxysporum f. sp. conglutinans Fo5176]|uniref:Uncharacterized protein n=1 Tax=Fusarium oxysporum (strain Fo5176) TaxID=660025 RepID=F9GCE3_FUSOF|nr:hypothetical protein FOXB_16326 [Fusarium oxysporum f. sp. conglutinans Fo5176]
MEKSLTLGDACKMLELYFDGRFRYIGPQGPILDLYQLFHHYIPSRVYATVNRIKGNEIGERQAMKTWKVVRGMNTVFKPYTNYTHDFRPEGPSADFDPAKYMHAFDVWIRLSFPDRIHSSTYDVKTQGPESSSITDPSESIVAITCTVTSVQAKPSQKHELVRGLLLGRDVHNRITCQAIVISIPKL